MWIKLTNNYHKGIAYLYMKLRRIHKMCVFMEKFVKIFSDEKGSKMCEKKDITSFSDRILRQIPSCYRVALCAKMYTNKI